MKPLQIETQPGQGEIGMVKEGLPKNTMYWFYSADWYYQMNLYNQINNDILLLDKDDEIFEQDDDPNFED